MLGFLGEPLDGVFHEGVLEGFRVVLQAALAFPDKRALF